MVTLWLSRHWATIWNREVRIDKINLYGIRNQKVTWEEKRLIRNISKGIFCSEGNIFIYVCVLYEKHAVIKIHQTETFGLTV